MEPIHIDWWMKDDIIPLYPHKKIKPNLYRIRWYNRWIQYSTAYTQDFRHVHYEMCASGYLCLHFEGECKQEILELSLFLFSKTCENDLFIWTSNTHYELGVCTYNVFITDRTQFMEAFRDFTEQIDSLISLYLDENNVEIDDPVYNASILSCLISPQKVENHEQVRLVDNLTLSDLFHLKINIPEYQRIYCWPAKNVRRLLDDITESHDTIRLGTIILHHNEDRFDIIDGQQRLVTLSLILRKLGYKKSPLLKLCFQSTEAMNYVAYNRYVIDNYVNKNIVTGRRELAKKLLEQLEFSVLVLDTDNIDLAYTFFSNENSRGKSLTDFDLLKAHHLRYVQENQQAQHLARNWDDMLSAANRNYDDNNEKPYYRSLGLYLFRLRHWMNYELWDDFAPYKIKNEYEAAPVIDEIPPLGAKFYFNESIQGGAHFFAYVKHFQECFLQFSKTDEYKSIHRIEGRSHGWYRDVIETLLFAYYLKFGVDYLSEALIGISRIILQFRYNKSKANYSKILEEAGRSGLLPIIDRATSPTFVLAHFLRKVRALPTVQPNLPPIARELRMLIKNNLVLLQKNKMIINDFKRII